MSQSQLRTLENYLRLMDTNAVAQIFRAAVELGLFDALAGGQKTAAEIAAACGAQTEPIELLLDALGATGAIERYGDDYALSQALRLLPPELRDLGDRYWRHLVEFARTGESIPRIAAATIDESDFHVEAAASQWLLTAAALDFAQVLDIGRSRRGLRVLELGSGGAVWGLTLAHRDPATRLTVIDRGPRLQAAREHAAAIGLGDRVTLLSGELHEVEPGDGAFDLVIVSHRLHHGSLDDSRVLLARCRRWLVPGGELAVLDAFPGQPLGDLHHRLFKLRVALRTDRGRVPSLEQLNELLSATGFASPQFAHLPSPPHTIGLLLAVRGE